MRRQARGNRTRHRPDNNDVTQWQKQKGFRWVRASPNHPRLPRWEPFRGFPGRIRGVEPNPGGLRRGLQPKAVGGAYPPGAFSRASWGLPPVRPQKAVSPRAAVLPQKTLRPRASPQAPRGKNGFAERLIGSIRRECVNHVVHLEEQKKSPATRVGGARTQGFPTTAAACQLSAAVLRHAQRPPGRATRLSG